MTKTFKTNTSASDAYRNTASDIARLIDALRSELDHHQQQADGGKINWGHVGDIDKVRTDLIDLVGFMTNSDSDQVKTRLGL